MSYWGVGERQVGEGQVGEGQVGGRQVGDYKMKDNLVRTLQEAERLAED